MKQEKTKTVSLFYLYGCENAGDMAICVGAIDFLQEVGYRVNCISRFTEGSEGLNQSKKYINKYFSKISVTGGLFRLDRSKPPVNVLKQHLVGGIKSIGKGSKDKLRNTILDSELVVFNGGNVMRCEKILDFCRLYAILQPFFLCRKMHMNYIFFPQSTSSINTLGLILIKKTLRAALAFWTREELSYLIFEDRLELNNARRGIDMAFFIKDREISKAEYKKKYKSMIKPGTIAFTFRIERIGDINKLDDGTIGTIQEEMVHTISHVLEKGKNVLFVIQSQKDKSFTRKIQSIFDEGRIQVIEEFDPLILREIYRHSELLVGMRLHSMILSLSVGTRVIGYFDKTWGHKNPGILNSFDMRYCYTGETLLSGYIDEWLNKPGDTKEILNAVERKKKQFLNDFINVLCHS